MAKQILLSLQPSEGIVVGAAATIYAAYIQAGRVSDGQENEWIKRSIREACTIAQITDQAIQSDDEMG